MSIADLTRPAIALPRVPRLIMPVVLVCLIGSQIAVTRSYSLFNRRLWLDEFHTLLLVEDPSLSHSMEALKHGADTNAPGLYLLTRAVAWVSGSTGPAVLRGVGMASILLGVVGVYASVRRVYSPWVALIASMAAWAHPLLTRHAFEARFYGPWFAGVVWLAIGLNLWDRSRNKVWPALLVAATSVLVCTIHYLGIISLAMVLVAHSLAVRRGWRASLARLVPAGLGVLALGACLPLYRGQRQSITVPTWIDPPSFMAVRDFFDQVFCYYLFAIPVAGFFATLMLGRGGSSEAQDESTEDVSELAGLASLAILPAALVVFSFAIQSVLIDRYAIAAIASFGPLLAPVVARTGRPARWAVLIGLVLVSTSNLMASSRWFKITEQRRTEATRELAKLADAPILCRSRADLYELWWDAPDARPRLFFWDPKDLAERPSNFDCLERDMARNHEQWYGLPRAASLSGLRDRPLVYLYGLDPKGVLEIERAEAGLRLRPVDARRGLYEAVRTAERVTGLN